MKMNLCFFLALISVVTSGCPAGTGNTHSSEKNTSAPGWDTFWPLFQDAVARGDMEAVAEFCQFPLRGYYPWSSSTAGLTRELFLQGAVNLFDEKAKSIIVDTEAGQVPVTPVADEEQAIFFEKPIGTELRSLSVIYTYESAAGSRKETIHTFYFGNMESQYRLVAVTFLTM